VQALCKGRYDLAAVTSVITPFRLQMLQILARSCDNNYIFTKGAFKRKSFRSVLYPDTLCLLDRQIFVYFIVVVRLCSHGFETYAAMMMMMMSVSTRVL